MSNPDGVPSLQDGDIQFDNAEPVDSDTVTVSSRSTQNLPWGIFDSSYNPVIVGNSVLAFEYDQDSNVSNYPVEQGGFESYNKVQQPFRVKFTITKSGTAAERADFLDAIKKAQNSLDLFYGLTSDEVYQNLTVDHHDLRRTARNGVELLTVDIWCQEVRQGQVTQFSDSSDTPQLSDPKNPESESPLNGGTVQGLASSLQSSIPAAASVLGTVNSTLNSISALTVPGISLTKSLGNLVPPLAQVVRSQITFSTQTGPASAAVSGIITGAANQITAYAARSGASVPVNLVTNILPPGFTVVQ